MILTLHHNFSNVDYTVEIHEVTVNGNYYSFEIPFPVDAPYGEYNYKLYTDSTYDELISSGIINYSAYLQNKYVVRDNILFTIYDAKN